MVSNFVCYFQVNNKCFFRRYDYTQYIILPGGLMPMLCEVIICK